MFVETKRQLKCNFEFEDLDSKGTSYLVLNVRSLQLGSVKNQLKVVFSCQVPAKSEFTRIQTILVL